MNSCEFNEIFVIKDFEVENGMLGLDRDCYLSIVTRFVNYENTFLFNSIFFCVFCST
jgi:hypothetical protein